MSIEKIYEIFFSDYNVGRFDCSSSPNTCTDLYIFKKPAFILFKQDGHYEFYYGKYLLSYKTE